MGPGGTGNIALGSELNGTGTLAGASPYPTGRDIMKRFFGIWLALALFGLGSTSALGATTPLASLDFNIVGIGLNATPDYQAVPKGIATHRRA